MKKIVLNVKKILPKGSFAKSVSVLVGGTAGAQVLMVLASPLLTRLYSPEDFGLLAVYAGLLAIFGVIASLRYELAIPLPETDAEAANVVILSLLVILAMTFISGLMVALAGEQIAIALDSPKLANYFWLLPVGVLSSGVYKVFNYWAIRTKTFGNIARTRIAQTLSTLFIQLVGFKLGGIALLFGQAIGQGVGSVRLAKSAFSNNEFYAWSWTGILTSAKRYRQFPTYSVWTGLFNTAGSQLPPILLASLFTAGAAGLFALAHRVLAMPMNILGGAIGNVFFANASDAHREDRLGILVLNVHLMLAKIAMPVTLILTFYAPTLFSFIFGDDWRLSGEIAQWMAPWLYFQFVSSPLSSVFAVLQKENKTAIFQGFVFIVRLACIIYGGIYLSLLQTVMIFSISSALLYILYLVLIFKSSGLGFLTFSSKNLKLFIYLSPSFAVYLVIQYFYELNDNIFWWILASSAYILSFYLISERKYFVKYLSRRVNETY